MNKGTNILEINRKQQYGRRKSISIITFNIYID